MVVGHLGAYVRFGRTLALRAGGRACGLAGVLSVLAQGRATVALEREWRLTAALAMKQLPAGMCLLARNSDGREWYIGPAGEAVISKMRKAA